MKKTFTILCAGILSLAVSAQTEQGGFLLSGSTGLDFDSEDVSDKSPSAMWPSGSEEKGSSLSFEMTGGYFVADGLAAGLTISYESECSETVEKETVYDSFLGLYGDRVTTNKGTQSTFMFAPMIRYYFGESGAWGQASYGFGSIKSKYDWSVDTPDWYGGDYEDENKVSGSITAFSIQGGYAIYLSDNISLNPRLGYVWGTSTIKDGYTDYEDIYDSFGNFLYTLTIEDDLEISYSGITFGLGIAIYLEK